MDSAEIAGFWSYTHEDNRRDGGRVLRLAELLQDEFALLTGSTLDVFIDRHSLRWGDEWKLRIENALATTTFFIPVMSPLYFKSEECRTELLRFIGHARSVGAEDLVLPLLYIDVPQLHAEAPGDEAIAVVKARQWQDCRELRLLADSDPSFRNKINALARRLIEINEALPVQAWSGAAPDAATSPDRTEEPGYMELFAAAEEAMPRWIGTIEALPAVLERLTAIAQDFGERMERSDAEGANFAKKLHIMRQLAEAMADPADEVLKLGQEYSASLVALDPAVLSVVRLIEEDSDQATPEEIHEFFMQLDELAANGRLATDQLRELIAILDQTRRMSRELGPPVDNLKQGLRQILDGQEVFDEWKLRFAAIEAQARSLPESDAPSEGVESSPDGSSSERPEA